MFQFFFSIIIIIIIIVNDEMTPWTMIMLVVLSVVVVLIVITIVVIFSLQLNFGKKVDMHGLLFAFRINYNYTAQPNTTCMLIGLALYHKP